MLDSPKDEVISQVEDERRPAEETVRGPNGVRDPQRAFLLQVCDAGSKPRPIADRSLDLLGCLAQDDADLCDPRLNQLLDFVEHHRLVGDRYQLLGARIGEGPKAASLAAGQHQALEPVVRAVSGAGSYRLVSLSSNHR